MSRVQELLYEQEELVYAPCENPDSSPLENSVKNDVAAPSCPVPSFETVWKRVRSQIEVGMYEGHRKSRLAENVALMVAETMCLPMTATVRIGGQELPATLVSEILKRLTFYHVDGVMDRFWEEDAQRTIVNRKTYLLTSLYNAVLEGEL